MVCSAGAKNRADHEGLLGQSDHPNIIAATSGATRRNLSRTIQANISSLCFGMDSLLIFPIKK